MTRVLSSRTRITAAVAAALLCLPLAACSAMSGAQDSGGADYGVVSDGQFDSARASDSMSEFAAESSSVVDSGRSIISSGGISIQVGDPAASVVEVADVAKSLGGYVESQNVTAASPGGAASASLSIRVPSGRFEQAFDELGELGRVLDQSSATSDVTAQQVDLKARVEALEVAVDRLNDLMSRAATTSELIEVESALSARQAELDGLKAQLTALEDQVDESTIWVSLSTESVGVPGDPSNFWEGLLAGLQSLAVAGAGALVVLGVLLPWLVIAGVIALVIIALVRSGRKRRARRASAAAQAPQESPVQQHVLAQQDASPQQPLQHSETAAEEVRPVE